MDAIARELGTLFRVGAIGGLTDAELLGRFVERREADAFEVIVRRHGPMVWGVCRRTLRDRHDAEDAFQGTFLVLARRAASVVPREKLGNWLYGVAYQTARKARAKREARRFRECRVSDLPEPMAVPDDSRDTLTEALDRELNRLPEKYRVPVILCNLQGKTHKEAASQLGWPVKTVSSRLLRARRLLARRLSRPGMMLTAGSLAVLTARDAASASVPTRLVSSTAQAASLYAAGVAPAGIFPAKAALLTEKMMMKSALACAAVGLAALVGFGLCRADPPAAPTPAGGAVPVPVAVENPVPLEGRWRCVGMAHDGEILPRWQAEAWRLTFTFAGDTLTAPRLLEDATFSRPAPPANAIDFRVKSPKGETIEVRGIYARDGDRLTLCLAMADSPPGDARPTGFDTKPGDGRMMFTLEKFPAAGPPPETAAERWGAMALDAQTGKLGPAALEAHAARCVEIAETAPRTDAATICLLWALANAPDGPAGSAALAALKDGGVAAANVETLALCLGVHRGTIGPGSIPDRLALELAPLLVERVRRTPDHPKAAELLCEACRAPDGAVEAPPAFVEAARMIGERWTSSPDITHFLESLSYQRQRPWAGRYETIVRAIATQSPDRYMRYRAAFTLAQLVAGAGEARQEEARQLYVRFGADCEPNRVGPSVAGLVEGMVRQARREADAMLVRGIGGPAPALGGVDLDGQPIALSDYRGKVVLLSFWATWCGPCLRLIPHERALAERFKDRPFAVVGVNGDEVEELDRKLIETHEITWRSFRNKLPGRKAIGSEWNVVAWPTLYLIDHTGTIRRCWSGTPPLDELDHETARWVAVAEGKLLAPALHPRAGAAPAEAIKGVPAKFIDMVHADEKGGEAKYVVCIPAGHDGKAPLPVVLFLHGSGQVGADNRKQLEIGFGPAVRKYGMPFPFVGVFPQARDGSWLAESPDGKRAMAILEAAEREYATDRRRVYLTGVSMGGEGVWSLAAAHPKRFAAIVPVCGGGDLKHVAVLKDVPCWAFHGDADQVVPVGATRDIVRAITAAGGRPLYQEYRGVDHNCWDRVYAEPEMYRWLRAHALR